MLHRAAKLSAHLHAVLARSASLGLGLGTLVACDVMLFHLQVFTALVLGVAAHK